MNAEIDDAVRHARLLPSPLGEAIVQLFAAVKPFQAGDGYLSAAVVGNHSPEMVKLARAVIQVTEGLSI